MATTQLDGEMFSRRLADVYRGLRSIGYEEAEAAAFVDSLCALRHECAQLRKAAAQAERAFAEAPVAWTVRYRSAQGHDCMLTLRGTDATAVLRQAHSVLEGLQGAEGGADWCEQHGVRMTRYGRDGRTWYAHRTPDGSWCHGGK